MRIAALYAERAGRVHPFVLYCEEAWEYRALIMLHSVMQRAPPRFCCRRGHVRASVCVVGWGHLGGERVLSAAGTNTRACTGQCMTGRRACGVLPWRGCMTGGRGPCRWGVSSVVALLLQSLPLAVCRFVSSSSSSSRMGACRARCVHARPTPHLLIHPWSEPACHALWPRVGTAQHVWCARPRTHARERNGSRPPRRMLPVVCVC